MEGFTVSPAHDVSSYQARRAALIERIRAAHPGMTGSVLLLGAQEPERLRFRQDSSFYYFTGLREPGLALVLDVENGESVLLVPSHTTPRSIWVDMSIDFGAPGCADELGIDRIDVWGKPFGGYGSHAAFTADEASNLVAYLRDVIQHKGSVFTITASKNPHVVEQLFMLALLKSMVSGLADGCVDIGAIIASMRRKKDMQELDALYRAIDITMEAQYAAAAMIEAGKQESDVQAAIEFVYAQHGTRASFPSIVATGKNTTVLHYTSSHAPLAKGDLVVVDIGAEYDHYCADLTRTYPVSGSFSKRQREIYDLVLDTQHYIADLAKPGYWLSNKEHPNKSLNHLARAYLQSKGYDKYFPHGIGHYLGLDVHDVGDYGTPLEPGDVITIEPGIYIPEESLGVRIEDNYWIVEDSAVCLSEALPSEPKHVERMAKENIIS